jgi:hypothetical protein
MIYNITPLLVSFFFFFFLILLASSNISWSSILVEPFNCGKIPFGFNCVRYLKFVLR